jgi:hypothetical protein
LHNKTIKKHKFDFIEKPAAISCGKNDTIFFADYNKVIQVDSNFNFLKEFKIKIPHERYQNSAVKFSETSSMSIKQIWADTTESGENLLYVSFSDKDFFHDADIHRHIGIYDTETGLYVNTKILEDVRTMGFDKIYIYFGCIDRFLGQISRGIMAYNKPLKDSSFGIMSKDRCKIKGIDVTKNENILFTFQKITSRKEISPNNFNINVSKERYLYIRSNDEERKSFEIEISDQDSEIIFFENKMVLINHKSIKIFELK